MTKRAVMYGGGDMGRGFVGALFAQSGYGVTFVDPDARLVEELNSRGRYPLRIVSNGGYEDQEITGVDAVCAGDTREVARRIAEADIMATAVDPGELDRIVPDLVAGIRARFAVTERPLDIILCVDLPDADRVLGEMLWARLRPGERERFDRQVGLVKAATGRIVPVQTPALRGDDPLRVSVEHYGFLPVDREAFRGPLPEIPQLVPVTCLAYYLRRKQFLHDMGRGAFAYLGLYAGLTYIHEAVADTRLHLLVKNAMLESAEALALSYGKDVSPLLRHLDDLIHRFGNRALEETAALAGRDPAGSLGPDGQLIGTALYCLEHGVYPAHIAAGAAAAVHRLLEQSGAGQGLEQAASALERVSGLPPEHELAALILDAYALCAAGADAAELGRWAGERAHVCHGDIL